MRKLLFIFIFLIAITKGAAQCAMCKAVVESGDETMAESINNGITYLMVFPYLLVGVLFYLLYRYRVKQKN